MPNISNMQIIEAKETYLALMEMSKLMNTKLDSESLHYCMRLCQAGVNPEALANIIQELNKEVASLMENGAENGQND